MRSGERDPPPGGDRRPSRTPEGSSSPRRWTTSSTRTASWRRVPRPRSSSRRSHSARRCAVSRGSIPKIRRAFAVADGSIDSWKLVWGCARGAEQHGAKILPYHPVTALVREGDRVVGARLHDLRGGEDVEVRAECVINAAGAWSGQIARMAGCEVGVRPGQGGDGRGQPPARRQRGQPLPPDRRRRHRGAEPQRERDRHHRHAGRGPRRHRGRRRPRSPRCSRRRTLCSPASAGAGRSASGREPARYCPRPPPPRARRTTARCRAPTPCCATGSATASPASSRSPAAS